MISSTSMNNPLLDLSPSVGNAMKRERTQEPVRAGAFVQAIFKLHSEYAGGSAASLQLVDTPSTRKAQEWLDEAQTLFDPERIRSSSKSDEPPTLHGRLLVIGLSLLEPRLREQLEGVGAFTALAQELREPRLEILTERGRALSTIRGHIGRSMVCTTC